MYAQAVMGAEMNARATPRVKGNRLRKVQRVQPGPTTTDVALYEYFADNRRSEKIVQHSGPEAVENDGGDTTVRFYYGGMPQGPAGLEPTDSRWNILETRNGSDQATFQYVWGTQYVDELVLIDKNLGPTVDSDADADVDSDAEQTIQLSQPALAEDARFLVHQDRNWNVVALTDYDPDSTVEGAVVERYAYTPYGEVTVLNGVGTTSREFGNVRVTSSVGHVFAFRGMCQLEHSCASRWGDYNVSAGLIAQRLPRATWLTPTQVGHVALAGSPALFRPNVTLAMANALPPTASSAGARPCSSRPPRNEPCPLGCRDCGAVRCMCSILQTCCVFGNRSSCCGGLLSPFCCDKPGSEPDCCTLLEILFQ